jgi:hypothetical protein
MINDGIKYSYPMFIDQMIPDGHLCHIKECHACFYFYALAQKSVEKVGNSIDDQFGTLEGFPWLDPHHEQLAQSVAVIYGLDSPDEFMKHWDHVIAEAKRCELPPPRSEYMKPLRKLS